MASQPQPEARRPDGLLVNKQHYGADQPEEGQEQVHILIVSVAAGLDNGGFPVAF